MTEKQHTYSKKERLKSAKTIDLLFSSGKTVAVYPLRLIYLKTEFEDAVSIKAAVSVSKRNFKKAAERNRIKRLMREVYRRQKAVFFNNMTTQYAFMFLYIGSEQTDFKTMDKAMHDLLTKFYNKEMKKKP